MTGLEGVGALRILFEIKLNSDVTVTKTQPCRNLGAEYSRQTEEQVKDTQAGGRFDMSEAHETGSWSEVQRIPGRGA